MEQKHTIDGNEDGFGVFDRLDNIEALFNYQPFHCEVLKSEINALRDGMNLIRAKELLRYFRETEVETVGPLEYFHDVEGKKPGLREFMHGADIMRDLACVWRHDRRNQTELRIAFAVRYGINLSEFERIGCNISRVPSHVLETLNKRSNMRWLHTWNTGSVVPGRKISLPLWSVMADTISKCNKIINAWRKSNRDGSPYPQTEMETIYEQIKEECQDRQLRIAAAQKF